MLSLAALLLGIPAAGAGRRILSFDADWRFHLGDPTGAEKPEFDDGAWRALSVPHDWSVEGSADRSNPSGRGGGFFPTGIGWYRKHFTLAQRDRGQRVFLDFDGVMALSDVWINGAHLGRRPYGYVSFRYELTQYVRFGSPNLVAVRVDNSGQPASRWYTGAGIDRHVRLVLTDPVHVEHWATFVTTPQVSAAAVTVHVASVVVNEGASARGVRLAISIRGPDGSEKASVETVRQMVEPGKTAGFEQDVTISRPSLWDLEHPSLYRAAVQVRAGNAVLDEEDVAFGIREARFEAATGFWLNGRNFKIKGVCLHADGGAFGAAVPLGVWERRLEQLKRIGVNAIRTAHHPPAPEFLDLADRMGFLVLDELFDAWTVGKAAYDYHLYFRDWSETDVRDTVRRDRNHPSIIAYSAGNEIHDTPNAEPAKKSLRSLLDVFHSEDPSRPVTQALFRPNVSHDYEDGLADMLDVVGQNYREAEILAAHEAKPSRKILGTENRHEREVWLALRDHAAYAGQFLWAGIDYLGESPGWPAISADFGLLDRTGAFKPRAYQRQSWWSDQPMVHIVRRVDLPAARSEDGAAPSVRSEWFSDWTPHNFLPHPENVDVYSNCEAVELELNGQSLGTKARPADDAPREWTVPFAPGRIQAICRNGDKVAATDEQRTAGPATQILLSTDSRGLGPGWDDVAFVTATVADAAGVPVPAADGGISFGVAGPGGVAAVDNADLSSHEPFQATERSAYQGWCVAVIRANAAGRLVVTASSPRLAAASLTLEAR